MASFQMFLGIFFRFFRVVIPEHCEFSSI